MASFITYVLLATMGTLVLGPVGLVAGLVLAWVINRNARKIEAQWDEERTRTLKDITRRNRS